MTGIQGVNGSSHGDTLTGDTNRNALRGGAGDDRLYGYRGADRLDGGAGNDVLTGGAGNDRLDGGAGNDTFVFRTGFGRDTITDFTAGAASDDVIEFDDVSGLSSYADVLRKAADNGTHTTITLDDDNTIMLSNVLVSDLHADDFRFA